MKFSKIHTDRPSLSAAEVAAGQSFGALLKQLNPTPWYQTGWFYASAGLAVLTVALVVVLPMFPLGEPDQPRSESALAPETVLDSTASEVAFVARIQPPLGDLLPQQTQRCISENGGCFTLGSCTVTVPANCFVDANGVPVKGHVDLAYSEYRDKTDLWLSGIPMEYDSAGTAYTFESDGMFALHGFQNGNPVFVADSKSIEVNMSRVKGGAEFSQYVLDEESGAWEFIKPATQPAQIGSESDSGDLFGDSTQVMAIPERYVRNVNVGLLRGPEGSPACVPAACGSSLRSQGLFIYSNEDAVIEWDGLSGQGAAANGIPLLDEAVLAMVFTGEGKDLDATFYYAPFSSLGDGSPGVYFGTCTLLEELKEANYSGSKKDILNDWIERSETLLANKGLVTVKPVAPVALNPDRYQIQLSYDQKFFPELDALNGVLFEVSEADAEEALAQSSQAWNKVDLQHKGDGRLYTLTFSKPSRTYSVDAYPVVPPEELESATAAFTERLASFEDLRKQRIREARTAAANARDATTQAQLSLGGANAEFAVQEVFTVKRFGFYNSDCPRNLPKGAVAHRSFQDRNGKTLAGGTGTVMLADASRNAVFRLYNGTRLTFNPRSTSAAWFITKSGDLAIARHADLVQSSSNKKPVHCDVIPVKDMGYEELRVLMEDALREEPLE